MQSWASYHRCKHAYSFTEPTSPAHEQHRVNLLRKCKVLLLDEHTDFPCRVGRGLRCIIKSHQPFDRPEHASAPISIRLAEENPCFSSTVLTPPLCNLQGHEGFPRPDGRNCSQLKLQAFSPTI